MSIMILWTLCLGYVYADTPRALRFSPANSTCLNDQPAESTVVSSAKVVNGIILGQPQKEKNMTVVMLSAKDSCKTKIRCATSLMKTGQVSFSDENITNGLSESIFVPRGLLLKGGSQDRVVTRSLLVPPKRTVPLPLMCVEHDRSESLGGEGNVPVGMIVGIKLYNAVMSHDQERLWEAIGELQRLLSRCLGENVKDRRSPSSLPRTLQHDRVRRSVAPSVMRLKAVQSPTNTGCAIFINGKLQSVYQYHSPEIFSAMWPDIAEAHAIEALANSDSVRADEGINQSDLESLLSDSMLGFTDASLQDTASRSSTMSRINYSMTETSELAAQWLERVWILKS